MSTALKQMTVDEFLLWAEGKEGRWELHDGAPVMISSVVARHDVARASGSHSHEVQRGKSFGRRRGDGRLAVRSLCGRHGG